LKITSIRARIPKRIYRCMPALLLLDKINWCIFSCGHILLAAAVSASEPIVLNQICNILIVSGMILVVDGLLCLVNILTMGLEVHHHL